ncbi:MAG: hypothetical protein J4478_01125 [Candidatus Diapherotrites archaeon]|uniref:Class III signal peptide-containing protein n=1 Tax=Candidatus Iainarchaeum sp. TaxID=3101447 RepID=A0A7J4JVN3_9ARCH|nr:MAG: hypothetical protein QT12_C0018G0004 [archaeon GW2011_AR21]MBS3057986.1 hypothetical protein [Candidatus Diapherotrites archaeon]HIH21831.1 hypothetical protein [Candidatus Diapherotrites archaeon]HIH33522.1 hypothetical protein [Candidatus Diapherotrites archaeon]
MNSKGQESGPFELLLAVILMGFVLLIGFQAIEVVQFNACTQQNDKMLEDFKTALEQVTHRSEQEKISLDFPACGTKKDQTVSLRTEQDPGICSKQCSTPRPTCTLLRLYNPRFSSIKCVNIPTVVQFSTSPDCGSIENYQTIDLFAIPEGSSIEEGSWIFRNITSKTASGTPVVCAFKECVGREC